MSENNKGYSLGKGTFPTVQCGKTSRHSSVVERVIGNDEAAGSIPAGGTTYHPRIVALFWSKVEVRPRKLGVERCWPWRASVDRHGYGQFKLGYGSSPLRAHRVAWEIFNGRYMRGGLHVLHSCDNPRCCNPWHLRPGTHSENMADKVARGRHKNGAMRKEKA